MNATPDKTGIAQSLFRIADDMVPTLAARVDETEALRRVPDQSIADLRDSGLLKAARPARYGGYELDLDIVIEIISRLGRGCGSTAWVYGIFCDHAITMGMMPLETQDEIWADDPETVVSSGLAPGGVAEYAEGGFRLSGRWQFSSGCDHADWVFVQSAIPPNDDGDDDGDGDGDSAAPTPAYFLLPRADFEIIDTWFVAGLTGTGSNDIVIEDVFVPAHRVQALALFNTGTGPGGAVNPGLIYRLPRIATVPFSLVAPALGILDTMIEAFTERTRERATRGFRHAELTTMQLRLAETSAERDCAWLLVRRATEETMTAMREAGRLELNQRARNRRDMAYSSMLCMRAADRLFQATGASGLFDGNPMRRMYSDIRAIGAHHVNAWDISGPIYGQVEFGLPPSNPSL